MKSKVTTSRSPKYLYNIITTTINFLLLSQKYIIMFLEIKKCVLCFKKKERKLQYLYYTEFYIK